MMLPSIEMSGAIAKISPPRSAATSSRSPFPKYVSDQAHNQGQVRKTTSVFPVFSKACQRSELRLGSENPERIRTRNDDIRRTLKLLDHLPQRFSFRIRHANDILPSQGESLLGFRPMKTILIVRLDPGFLDSVIYRPDILPAATSSKQADIVDEGQLMIRKSNWFIFLLLIGPMLATSAARAQTARLARRPNIVFMLIDDLGWGELGC